jgi:phosphoglycolate phosphatase
VFVVTNKRHPATERVLAEIGVAERVTAFRAPEDPDNPWTGKADALCDLIDRYGLDREATAYVGDSSDDRVAALLAGLPFVAAAYGYGAAGSDAEGVDLAVVNSLSRLLAFLSSDVET